MVDEYNVASFIVCIGCIIFRQILWHLVDFAFNHNSLIYAGPIIFQLLFGLFFTVCKVKFCIQINMPAIASLK